MDENYLNNIDMHSNISLLHVNFTPVNQLDFASYGEQSSYFTGLERKQYISRNFNDINSGVIQLEGKLPQMYQYNYAFIDNYDTNNNCKRYFMWITDFKQAGKDIVLVYYEIDVFQTFMFDYDLNQCLVEREHVKDDSIGKNIIPENFELGEYNITNVVNDDSMNGGLVYVISFVPKDDCSPQIFGNKVSPMSYKIFDGSPNGLQIMGSFIQDLNNKGQIDCISYIFCFPYDMLDDLEKSLMNSSNGSLGNSLGYKTVSKQYPINYDLFFNGYKPKNNKLYMYPFCFITGENDEGNSITYKLENCKNNMVFAYDIDAVFDKDSVFQLVPTNYRFYGKNFADAITNNGYGLCEWVNDSYANWYAQNKNSLRQQQANITKSWLTQDTIASNNYNQALRNKNYANQQNNVNMLGEVGHAGVGILGNLLNGQFGSALSSGANAGITLAQMYASNNINQNQMQTTADNNLNNSRLANETSYQNASKMLMAQKKDMEVMPNTLRGSTQACGLDVARKTNTFIFKQFSINSDFAERIDLFFQMYGYEVDRVKMPETNTRKRWNYIKTVNSNITGNIPQKYIDILNGLYNQGFTIWHKPEYIFQYNISNDIIKE